MKTKKKSEAFTLVEVVIALGIAAVSMFALQGLIPSSLKVVKNATDQTAATTMLSSITQDLRNTPSGSNASPGFGIPMPDLNNTNAAWLTSTNLYLSEDGLGVLAPTQARYAAYVTLTNAGSPNANNFNSLTTARIKVYWPATVDPSKAQGSVESVTFFNRQMQRGGIYIAKKTSGSTTQTAGPYNSNGYNKYGYNSQGQRNTNYNNNGYNSDGYDSHGCDRYGHRTGYDCDGHDSDGRDCEGYDADGHDKDGYDREGDDCDGNHKGTEHESDHGCGEND